MATVRQRVRDSKKCFIHAHAFFRFMQSVPTSHKHGTAELAFRAIRMESRMSGESAAPFTCTLRMHASCMLERSPLRARRWCAARRGAHERARPCSIDRHVSASSHRRKQAAAHAALYAMAFEAITLHTPDDRGDPRTKRSYPRAACRWAAIRACAADPHASFVVRRASCLRICRARRSSAHRVPRVSPARVRPATDTRAAANARKHARAPRRADCRRTGTRALRRAADKNRHALSSSSVDRASARRRIRTPARSASPPHSSHERASAEPVPGIPTREKHQLMNDEHHETLSS